ncbi:MAG: ABC transporter ATP-binding protein [Clostridium sp.]|nr:MAG: ABC transporter ATP-binding protein [Clostridium sp.]
MKTLEIENLTKVYPAFTLDDVSFSVESGRIMGFIGRNGAGKSTTLKCLLGFVHKDGGTVKFFGKDFSENEKEIKSRVGYVSGGADYYVTKKTENDNRRHEEVLRKTLTTRRIAAILKKIQPGRKPKTVKALSQGMKVKYSLALALSHNADLLILDEPTSGLDPVSREDLLDVFLSLKDDGKTILFSTHVTSDLDKCADDITYIRNGKIFASEPTDTFKEKYKLAFVKKDAFTDDIAACSHGVRRLKDGLSVLISADKAAVLNIETTDASLEDIMVHLEKEEL